MPHAASSVLLLMLAKAYRSAAVIISSTCMNCCATEPTMRSNTHHILTILHVLYVFLLFLNVTRHNGDSPNRGGSRQLTPPLPAQPEVQLVRRETGEVRAYLHVLELTHHLLVFQPTTYV
jgi:hypothetical protein